MHAKILAILIASWTAVFTAIFVVFISVFAKPSQPHYFKRVAKKYSISPLNLR
jgi:hypothetical protein